MRPRILLKDLLLSLGEDETGQELLADLVGEAANTILGNAQNEFGNEFMISVPIIM